MAWLPFVWWNMNVDGVGFFAAPDAGGANVPTARFEKILAAVGSGSYLVNKNYDVTLVGPDVEREAGRMNGRKCCDYFHERKEPCPWCKRGIVFGGGSVGWEWFSPKSGKTLGMYDSPVINHEGAVFKLGVFSDVTKKKQIDDILKMSRIKSGVISPAMWFADANLLVQSVLELNSGAAKSKGIELKNEVPPHTRLYCDMRFSGEVFSNLVSNGIKFSSTGGTVRVGLKDGEPSTFFVVDSGVGIHTERIPKLFQFDEPKSTRGTTGESGTGFGLPLCNELMKSMGGSVSITSSRGEGTTVFLMFPRVRPKALVVDDSKSERFNMAAILREIGVEVIEASDGEEALRLMHSESPHLVLLDILMPGMDGLEVLRDKQKNSAIRSIPTIVVTGNNDPGFAERAFQLGATDWLNKPFEPDVVCARVRKVVS